MKNQWGRNKKQVCFLIKLTNVCHRFDAQAAKEKAKPATGLWTVNDRRAKLINVLLKYALCNNYVRPNSWRRLVRVLWQFKSKDTHVWRPDGTTKPPIMLSLQQHTHSWNLTIEKIDKKTAFDFEEPSRCIIKTFPTLSPAAITLIQCGGWGERSKYQNVNTTHVYFAH